MFPSNILLSQRQYDMINTIMSKYTYIDHYEFRNGYFNPSSPLNEPLKVRNDFIHDSPKTSKIKLETGKKA